MMARKILMIVAAGVMSLGGAQAASADDVFWKIGTRFPVGDGAISVHIGGGDIHVRGGHARHRCTPRCAHFQRGHRCSARCDHWDRRDRHRHPGWRDHRCDRTCGHWERGRRDRDHWDRGRHDRRPRWNDRRGRRWSDDCDDRRGRDRRRSRRGGHRRR